MPAHSHAVEQSIDAWSDPQESDRLAKASTASPVASAIAVIGVAVVERLSTIALAVRDQQ